MDILKGLKDSILMQLLQVTNYKIYKVLSKSSRTDTG